MSKQKYQEEILEVNGYTIHPGDLVVLNNPDGNEPRLATYRGVGPLVRVSGYWCEFPKHGNELLWLPLNYSIKPYEGPSDFVPEYAKTALAVRDMTW